MHPLFGANLRTVIGLALRDGPVAPGHAPMLAGALLSAAARLPFRLSEEATVAWHRRRMPPMPPPIFIVGHWRSGTTHLYNILSQAEFAFVCPFAAGLPGEYRTLGRWLRPLLTRLLPQTRYVDEMAVTPFSPQEDEIPLGSMAPISFYHGIYFPRHFERHLNRSLFLDGCTDAEIEAWEDCFRLFMDKLWIDQGRRLLIKNPTYSARMPQLKRLYPDARFIHVYRNPHAVFRSTRRFYRALLDRFAWQDGEYLNADLDRLVLESYRRMMNRIEIDKACLSKGDVAELRFEDLEAQPLVEIERLYRELDLGDAQAWLPRFEVYLNSVRGFQKTFIPEGPNDRSLVENHCADLLVRFGYAAP